MDHWSCTCILTVPLKNNESMKNTEKYLLLAWIWENE